MLLYGQFICLQILYGTNIVFCEVGRMIFPLEELVKFKGNVYEITCAASRRAYQLAMVKDPVVEENDGKVVSLAARQLFTNEVQYRIEQR